MNIEDIIIALSLSTVRTNRWDQGIVESFYDQISQGRGFTEKQQTLALKIVKRYQTNLSLFLNKDLTTFIENPCYRLAVRTINNEKKISIAEHESIGKCIFAVFPYSEQTVQKIRASRDSLDTAQWNKETKSWIFSLSEKNIQFLLEMTADNNFEFDEEFSVYANQVKTVTSDFEKYVPILTIEDKILKFSNFSENLPPLESTDIMPALFEARQKGIFTWHDTISNYVESDEVDETTRDFLKSDPSDKIHLDSEILPISSLKNIVTHMTPSLFIVPGGSELEKLSNSLNFLKDNGFDNSEISVMFRMPTETHENFNNFIKQQGLNNPISEKTKIVFVSSKLPKPVINSKIKFHCVINLGINNVHYTLRDFIKNHENLISYAEKSKQKEFTFVIM